MEEKCTLEPGRDCLGLQKARMLEKLLDKYMGEARDTHHQLYDRITALEKSDAARSEQYRSIMEKLDELGQDISKALHTADELRQRPAKKWDALTGTVVTAIVSGIVGVVIGLVTAAL